MFLLLQKARRSHKVYRNTQPLLIISINIWCALVAAAVRPERNADYSSKGGLIRGHQYQEDTAATGAVVRQGKQDLNYAMLVDCGSSGSQAFIYYWPTGSSSSKSNSLDKKFGQIKKLRDERTGEDVTLEKSPGLSSVHEEPSTASDYMRPFMDFARDHIPVDKRPSARVMFMATAGLRLINDSLQHRIMHDIITDLKQSYPEFKDIRARVISGFEEGSYMWLSANGVADKLTGDPGEKGRPLLDRYGREKHYSVIEMGGASVQVTFGLTDELRKQIKARLARSATAEAQVMFDRSHQFVKTDSNRGSEVFSISFLGFGSNKARELATNLLVRDYAQSSSQLFTYANQTDLAGSTLLLEDPCLPPGGSQVIRKPVRLLMNNGVAIKALGQPVEDGEPMFNARFIGTRGHYKLCQSLLKRSIVLAKAERYECPHKAGRLESCPVSLLAVDFVPFDRLRAIGLGELFYISQSFYDTTGLYNAPDALNKIIRLCSVPYQTLLKQYPQEIHRYPKQILLGCFKANWTFVWLHFALRMPQNYLSTDLILIQKLNNIQIEWTRGAIIAELLAADSLK